MLKAFKEYCALTFPSVIPVYITFSDLSSAESVLNRNTVLEIVKKELEKNNIETAKTTLGEMKGDQIVEALKKHEKYVLLLVDEFDELFRVREGNSEVENIIQTRYLTSMSTLGDFMWLGNQKTGRFAVLLCGSSASCPLLVTLNANKDEFPLQKDAPNLGGLKYRTIRLPVHHFLDMDVSKTLLAHFLPDCTENLAKLITFCVGINPRKYSILSQGIHEGVGEFSAFHYGNHESGVSLAGNPQLNKFRDKLLIKMREKNNKVLEMIQDDVEGTVNAYKVMETNWIPHFQPLTISEVKSVWIELPCDQQQQLNTTESLEKFQQALFFLADKDQLSLCEISIDGLPSSVFPISAAQVFMQPNLDIHRPFIKSANIILKAEFQALKK